MKHEKFSIRTATPDELDQIVSVVETILAEYGYEPDYQTSELDLAEFDSTYLESRGTFEVVVDEARKVVGTAALQVISDDTCKLRKMYLMPNVRGQGLGRKLLTHVVSKARELGFEMLTCETTHRMKEAIPLYESFGFRRVDNCASSPRCDIVFEFNL